jgi:hypothetical protein
MDASASAAYLLRSVRLIDRGETGMPEEGSPAIPPNVRIRIAGQGKIELPRDRDGVLSSAAVALTGPARWPRNAARAALSALLTTPAFGSRAAGA